MGAWTIKRKGREFPIVDYTDDYSFPDAVKFHKELQYADVTQLAVPTYASNERDLTEKVITSYRDRGVRRLRKYPNKTQKYDAFL